ncbi:MAG TPA: hypothetical protein VGU64_12840, partial [Terriglobales bacterium]|nr:hypothetical protein [Terriglobales bacterium]
MLNEPGNTYDRARRRYHTVCFLWQMHSAMPRKRTEILRPNSYTNGGDASDATRPPLTFPRPAFYTPVVSHHVR